MGLIFDILPYYVSGDFVTYTPNKVSIAPKLSCPQLLPVLRYPHEVILQIIYGMFCPSNPHAVVIQDKALSRQAALPRLTASHFPPASKLAGIQWSLL